jgi:hypothetical protein
VKCSRAVARVGGRVDGQLAAIGGKRFQLIDLDPVEASNLSMLVGSKGLKTTENAQLVSGGKLAFGGYVNC